MLVIAKLCLVAFVFGLLERTPRLRAAPQPFFRRGFGTDLLHLAVTSAVTSGMVAWIALASDALAALGVPRLASLGGPSLAFALPAFALLDLGQTLVHRALHRFEPLWELHKVHHSSPALDWLATFRAHGAEHLVRSGLAPLGLIALGPPIEAVALAAGVHGVVSIANHANLSGAWLGWLEPVFVTPRLHRVHHVARCSERNFAVALTLWDRLLGSFAPARDATAEGPLPVLGVPGEEQSYPQRWSEHLVLPLRRIAARQPRLAAQRNTMT